MIELIIVLGVLGILAAAVAPKISKGITSSRLQRAQNVVRNDLQLAVSLASRHRAPVRLERYAANDTLGYVITDRATGTRLFARDLGLESDFQLNTLTFSIASVIFFPNGITSSPLVVDVNSTGGVSRRIQMTKVGFVRTP